MKKKIHCHYLFLVSIIMALLAPAFLFGEDARFQAPTFDVPYYRIVFGMAVEQDNCSIQKIGINGREWESFLAFQDGKNVDLSKPLPKGHYTMEVDYAWTDNKEYRISVSSKNEDTQEMQEREIRGKAPAKGGVPAEYEGFYRCYRAEELVGIERRGEICTAVCTVPKEDFENQGFILMDGTYSIPCQILDARESVPPEKSAGTHPVTLTYKMAFPLDMPPRGKKLLLLFKSEREAEKPGFTIAGEGWGKTIKNRSLELEFHPRSGQVNTVENTVQGIEIFNEVGVIHWNPGVHIPGIAWDHSFNWDPPPGFEETAGRYLYINTRRGPLQRIKEVDLQVRYTLGVDWPYFVSETSMTFQKDLGVSAIRNDEMVLYKELFDSLLYRDKAGKTVKMPLEEKRDFADGLVHVAPDDLGWVGLVNSEKNFGFFSVRVDYANTGLSTSGTWLNKPGTYFYAPSSGKYVYWVRPLVYTWSEFTTRNLLTYVPEGSVFYEKNAYIILPLDEELPRKLDRLLEILRNPLRVY